MWAIFFFPFRQPPPILMTFMFLSPARVLAISDSAKEREIQVENG
jgi:hypothetical protein